MLNFNISNLIKKQVHQVFTVTLSDGYDFNMSVSFLNLCDGVKFLVSNLDDDYSVAKQLLSALIINDNSVCNLADVQAICKEHLDNGCDMVFVHSETKVIY